MKKEQYVMAGVTVGDELKTSGCYKVVAARTDSNDIDRYTVVNELGDEVEYEEDLFDLENK